MSLNFCSIYGPSEIAPYLCKASFYGEVGALLRLMGNKGVISETLFLEAWDGAEPPETLHITALVSGIWPDQGCPNGSLFRGRRQPTWSGAGGPWCAALGGKPRWKLTGHHFIQQTMHVGGFQLGRLFSSFSTPRMNVFLACWSLRLPGAHACCWRIADRDCRSSIKEPSRFLH